MSNEDVARIADAAVALVDHILDRNIFNRIADAIEDISENLESISENLDAGHISNAIERIADLLEEKPQVDSRKEIAAVHNDFANRLSSILNETDDYKRAYKLRRLATEALKTAQEAYSGTQTGT